MKWEFNNELPIHNQLVEQLIQFIINGNYKLGEKLPSVRDLAREAKVNPNTMQKALLELENINLIITKRTSGKYVSDNEKLINKFKEKKARSLTNNYIKSMTSIGYNSKEIKEILRSVIS